MDYLGPYKIVLFPKEKNSVLIFQDSVFLHRFCFKSNYIRQKQCVINLNHVQY